METPAVSTGKRAAEDTLPVSLAKRPRSNVPSSINNVLRQHASKRLYVEPLFWNEQHLCLLGCEFVAESDAAYATRNKPAGTKENKSVNDASRCKSMATIPRFLRPDCQFETKADAIKGMLRDYDLCSVRYTAALHTP